MKHNCSKANTKGEAASVIQSLLDASKEIADFLRHSPIIAL